MLTVREGHAASLSVEEQHYLKNRGPLVFISQTHYPPFEFQGPDKERTGMCTELVRWISTELGFKALFMDTSFQQAQEAVLSGKAEVLTSLFSSDKRAQVFDFTNVMFQVPASIFVAAERPDIKDLKGLEGKTIAMQTGDYAQEYLESRGIAFRPVYTKNFAEATDLVIAGKADAIIGDEQIVLYHIFSNNLFHLVKKVGTPLYVGQNCMAVKTPNPMLIGILNKGIKMAQEGGVLNQINHKWLGTHYSSPAPWMAPYLSYVIVLMGAVLLLVPLIWLWNIKLRQQVALRTRELADSEERFRNLLEYVPGVAIQGYSTDGIVHYWNKASEKIYGYSAEEALGKKQVDLIVPPDLKGKFLRALEIGAKSTRSGEFVPPSEHFLLHKDGSKVPIYAIHTVICLKDKPPIMFCLEVDLSERKTLETERARVSRLESLGILAGGIAHDFNNLLTAIVGNINLISLDSQLSEYNRERLLKAENACRHAQGLSKRLLTFAKGGEPIKKITVINNLIIETANLILSGSKSRCNFSIPADLWPVEVDEGQINQVFSNLLINADQAMPLGGIIELRAENLRVGTGIESILSPEKNKYLFPGRYIKITVDDQGVGISPDHLDKIFDPYFTTKSGCSGLGLTTTYSIIKNHQGYINLESEVGKGTKYYVYLPAIESGAPIRKPEMEKPVVGQGKILIMDDDENVRDVLAKMLGKIGYEAVSTGDGTEAIEVYKQALDSDQPMVAVIFDLTIPGGMGGQEALAQLLKINPQIKAIVSSGYSDDLVMAEYKNYGFSGVIPKPYRLTELSAILHEVINGP